MVNRPPPNAVPGPQSSSVLILTRAVFSCVTTFVIALGTFLIILYFSLH